MAELVITIPDEHAARFRDAIAGSFGYEPLDGNGEPYPYTKAEYVERKVKQSLIQRALRHERKVAIEAIDIEPIDIT